MQRDEFLVTVANEVRTLNQAGSDTTWGWGGEIGGLLLAASVIIPPRGESSSTERSAVVYTASSDPEDTAPVRRHTFGPSRVRSGAFENLATLCIDIQSGVEVGLEPGPVTLHILALGGKASALAVERSTS